MRKWIPFFIVVAAIIASAITYPASPPTIATHWDLQGHPNGWSNRAWGVWMIPLFLIGMWALLRFLPVIDPRGRNYAKFGGAFEGIMISLMLFMLGLHLVVFAHIVLFAVILLCSAGVMVYSYLEWRREQRPASPVS